MALRISLLASSLALLNSVCAVITLTTSLPGSHLDNQIVNAAGQSFFVGGSPSTYCPTVVEPNCPNVTGTVLAGMGAMWVEVPGGQQTYVTPEGKYSFTQAHSSYIPIGSYIGGWKNILADDCEFPYNLTTFQAPNSSLEGVLACPYISPVDNSTTDRLQIYAPTPAFNRTDCTALAGLMQHTRENNDFGAWQYV
ncbi:IgE-binding protein [Phlyctema vagabunda]|uniref:IgE-binding protein n=1 Tax=Phlyctema vagabunda TaxID=108571 RepID=A0ABR4PEE3_9HELO